MLKRILVIVAFVGAFCAFAVLARSPLERVYRHFSANSPAVPKTAYTTLRRPSGAPSMQLVVRPFVLHSSLVERSLREVLIVPKGDGKGRPLLVLLHGRGSSPGQFLSRQWLDGLAALGAKAPDVLLVNGGDHSYYHDRADGRWGSYLIQEAIPAGLARSGADPGRIAIGGISMGGAGALDLAVHYPGRFCAAGGHSAALWLRSGDTASGAYDDAADFEHNDVIGLARKQKKPTTLIWLDNSNSDPFLSADSELAAVLQRAGRQVSVHVWPGAHSSSYWNHHAGQYLRFYADALADC